MIPKFILLNPWLRQIGMFGAVGLVQVAIDSGILIGLTRMGVEVALANVISRLSGASAGFLLNGTTTFSDQTERRLHKRHLARFVITWIVLTIISTTLLWILHKYGTMGYVWLAKPVVEVMLAFGSFFLSKLWIYK